MGSSDFYKGLLDEISDGVYFVDRDRKITYWNKSAEELSGYPAQETLGHCCSENILVHVDDKGASLCTGGCPLSAAINDGLPRQSHVYMKHKDGYRMPVFVRVKPIRDDDGNIIGGVETFKDDTSDNALKNRIGELERMALLDGLTGIGNRRFADITLSSRLNELKRNNWPFGIILFDIDNFKKVNDIFGHNTGDEVLTMISRTLTGVIREPDTSLYRWGGEEFLVIASNCDAAKLYWIAERIRVMVATSVLPHDSGIVNVTISAGGTVALPDDSSDSVVGRADGFLYQAKHAGKNCCRIDVK
jgi:diguanylate cyclase (GGDEF)-like protein/PAS domain S-box-containing protein